MASLGAGATLAGLVSAVPQLVWLSERKAMVFGIAGVMLLVSALMLWNARRLPCPVDPRAARACIRLRRLSHWLFGCAALLYLVGALYAFVLPRLTL